MWHAAQWIRHFQFMIGFSGTHARCEGTAPRERDPEAGQRVFCPGGTRPAIEVLLRFVDSHRGTYGIEPICSVLQIAPSGYRRRAMLRRAPQNQSARVQRDEILVPQIERVWNANLQVYGADNVWHQLERKGFYAARCTVERLIRQRGLRGVVRGKIVRTTFSDHTVPCPRDKVHRQFRAERPNQLWAADFTYVSTWQGWLYVAFVIDVFARRIVGWWVSTSRCARTSYWTRWSRRSMPASLRGTAA